MSDIPGFIRERQVAPTVIVKKTIAPAGLKNHPDCDMTEIKYITVHTTDVFNALADAENVAGQVCRGSVGGRSVGYHYIVDDKQTYQCFEDGKQCRHSGYNEADRASLSVAVCVNRESVFIAACKKAAELIAALLIKHDLAPDAVKTRKFWLGLEEPKKLLDGSWGMDWPAFITEVKLSLKNQKRELARRMETGENFRDPEKP